MLRKIVVGSGLLIALYLGVAYATGAGQLIRSAASGASDYAKTLQGR
ncbi:MAG TPA: hypothetical protein VHA75_21295 [Rugosimonospora sp.]|nr:hypothetical protein [Rugosimonospora sp.]